MIYSKESIVFEFVFDRDTTNQRLIVSLRKEPTMEPPTQRYLHLKTYPAWLEHTLPIWITNPIHVQSQHMELKEPTFIQSFHTYTNLVRIKIKSSMS